MASSDFATEGQLAALVTALRATPPTFAAYWHSSSGTYRDARGSTVTSVPSHAGLVLYGGTEAQRDAQGWLPASGWAHFPEVLTP